MCDERSICSRSPTADDTAHQTARQSIQCLFHCCRRGSVATPIKSEIGKALVGASSRWHVENGFVMAGGKTRKRGSREESAFLELVRSKDILSRRVSQTLERRSCWGPNITCSDFARSTGRAFVWRNRQPDVTWDPDSTRLLDRLEKRGLFRALAKLRTGRR